jgi:hypothetical protein
MTKQEALAKFLGYGTEGVEQSSYDENSFSCGREEYLVLTDSEADEKTREYILDSVWAFNPNFLASHAKEGIDEDVIKAIQDNGKCESNNKALTALLDDVDHFVNDAIRSDGRGHFLSSYDGEENEEGQFFIYRTN